MLQTIAPAARRAVIASLVALGASLPLGAGGATAAEKLRFAVGPFQPTPGDT